MLNTIFLNSNEKKRFQNYEINNMKPSLMTISKRKTNQLFLSYFHSNKYT